MNKFTFIEGITKHKKGVAEKYKDINEEIEASGFKKAVKGFQNKQQDCHHLRVKYTNKAGNDIDRWVKIPMGRYKRLVG